MRKSNFLYVAAAALSLSFAACSQEDISGTDIITPEMATSYAKVKISMGGGLGTRAFGSGSDEFDLGTAEEAAVKSIKLLLFDDNNSLVGSGSASGPFSTSTDRNSGTSTSNPVSDTYQNAIVKVTLNPGSSKPTKLIAYINSDDVYPSYDAAMAAKTGEIGDKTKGFVMTNSGYYSGGVFNVAVEISDDNLYATKDEAQSGEAVTIHVERLAAKIGVALKEGELQEKDRTANVAIYGTDGKKYDIVFDAKKWAATGIAPEMYSLKQAYGTAGFGWADGTNRSYWAKGVLYDNEYESYLASPRPLKYLSANQVISDNGGIGHAFGSPECDYVTEHTFGEKARNGEEFNAKMTATSAIVVGQYKVTGEGADEKFKVSGKEYYDFYLERAVPGFDEDGREKYIIYTKEELIWHLFEKSGIRAKTEQFEPGDDVTAENVAKYLNLKKKKGENQYVLTTQWEGKNSDDKIWHTSPSEEDEVTDEDLETTICTVKHYYMGWAYFFAPIEHYFVDKKTVGSYGVVRNHSYNLTVNSILGLGAPLDEGQIGNDPENTEPDPENPENPGDKPIEPNPDDIRDAYLDATLEVMSWHNVNNDVNL